MAVSKRARFEVLKRDNHTCRYCGASAPDVAITVDHVLPTALGGSDGPGNLVAACRDCNAGKSSTAPDATAVEDVAALDLQWADAMRRAADVLAAQRNRENEYVSAFADEWEKWGGKLDYADPDSLVRLYAAGLPRSEMLDAIRVAMSAWNVRDRFSYFMGVSWKRLTAMQETAKELLAADDQGGQ